MFHAKEKTSLKGETSTLLNLAVCLYSVLNCNILGMLTSLLSLGAIVSLRTFRYFYSLNSLYFSLNANTIYFSVYIHKYSC